MRVVFQRVHSARVTVEEEVVGEIGAGALLLVGVREGDGEEDAVWLAKKIAGLRVFSDADEKFNLSLLDIGGEALVVSNFTLYGNCRRGKRPEFITAARPEQAAPLIERFMELLRDLGIRRVESGRFGAHMHVHMEGDGPVTLILDSPDKNIPPKG